MQNCCITARLKSLNIRTSTLDTSVHFTVDAQLAAKFRKRNSLTFHQDVKKNCREMEE